jgi:myosin heavy subunit
MRSASALGAATNTVGTQFKRELGELIHTLSCTRTHYVRCIKVRSG